jgi:hypothetical protein
LAKSSCNPLHFGRETKRQSVGNSFTHPIAFATSLGQQFIMQKRKQQHQTVQEARTVLKAKMNPLKTPIASISAAGCSDKVSIWLE